MDPDFDIESLRNTYESDKEWNFRKKFISANFDKLPFDRLICLASCFLNVEMMGCSYPQQVMEDLKHFSEDMQDELDEHRERVRARTQVKFVKESSDDKSKNSGEVSKTCEGKQKSYGGMNFVKASDDFKSTEFTKASTHKPVQFTREMKNNLPTGNFKAALNEFANTMQESKNSETLNKFYQFKGVVMDLGRQKKNAVETIHMAADKLQMAVQFDFVKQGPRNGFTGVLKLDFVTVGQGTASNKKSAKHATYENVLQVLASPYLDVVSMGSDYELHGCTRPPERTESSQCATSSSNDYRGGMVKLGQATQSNIGGFAKNSRKRPHPSNGPRPLEEFMILEPKEPNPCLNATGILQQSAAFNKFSIEYSFAEVGKTQTRCILKINGKFIADHVGDRKLNLKADCSEKALEKLKKICWTIKTKQVADSDETGLTREELVGGFNPDTTENVSSLTKAIPDSNVGSKLLRMMGWTGGGVGKKGQGIAEPVAVNTVINREGLGLQAEKGIGKNFLTSIRDIINNYIRSYREDDLVFSPEFNKEERAMIHKESQRLGLKSHSHGKGDDRFLVLSRKRNASQLFSHIMHHGGSTSKYDLIPPGEDTEVN